MMVTDETIGTLQDEARQRRIERRKASAKRGRFDHDSWNEQDDAEDARSKDDNDDEDDSWSSSSASTKSKKLKTSPRLIPNPAVGNVINPIPNDAIRIPATSIRRGLTL